MAGPGSAASCSRWSEDGDGETLSAQTWSTSLWRRWNVEEHQELNVLRSHAGCPAEALWELKLPQSAAGTWTLTGRRGDWSPGCYWFLLDLCSLKSEQNLHEHPCTLQQEQAVRRQYLEVAQPAGEVQDVSQVRSGVSAEAGGRGQAELLGDGVKLERTQGKHLSCLQQLLPCSTETQQLDVTSISPADPEFSSGSASLSKNGVKWFLWPLWKSSSASAAVMPLISWNKRTQGFNLGFNNKSQKSTISWKNITERKGELVASSPLPDSHIFSLTFCFCFNFKLLWNRKTIKQSGCFVAEQLHVLTLIETSFDTRGRCGAEKEHDPDT